MPVLFNQSGNDTNGYMIFFVDGQSYHVKFQGIPLNLQDSRTASYQEEPIAKRTEPLLIYQFTQFREISFSLSFGAQSADEAWDLHLLASLLRRSVFPTTEGYPMYCKLNLGPWFINYKASGRALGRDEYTEEEEGMKCVIKSYGMTPSDKRLNDESIAGAGSGVPDWWKKTPSKVDVSLNLYVFLDQVWATGTDLCGGSGTSVESSESATSVNQPDGTSMTTDTPSPQPGDPNFIGPTQSPPKPGDENFIGPIQPSPTEDSSTSSSEDLASANQQQAIDPPSSRTTDGVPDSSFRGSGGMVPPL